MTAGTRVLRFVSRHFAAFGLATSLLAIPIAVVVALIVNACCIDFFRSAGYRAVVSTAGRAGRWILVVSAIVLVGEMTAMSVYTIRRGQKRGQKKDDEGRTVTEDRAPNWSLGTRLPIGRTKQKLLVSRREGIRMKSLVDGTATTAERLVALGIGAAFTSFFLVFVGVSLILLEQSPIGLLFLTIPSVFFFRFVKNASRDYRRARARGHR